MAAVVSFVLANKLAIIGVIPMITRAYYGLKNNGGLVGMWRAVMFGTNTPKKNDK